MTCLLNKLVSVVIIDTVGGGHIISFEGIYEYSFIMGHISCAKKTDILTCAY